MGTEKTNPKRVKTNYKELHQRILKFATRYWDKPGVVGGPDYEDIQQDILDAHKAGEITQEGLQGLKRLMDDCFCIVSTSRPKYTELDLKQLDEIRESLRDWHSSDYGVMQLIDDILRGKGHDLCAQEKMAERMPQEFEIHPIYGPMPVRSRRRSPNYGLFHTAADLLKKFGSDSMRRMMAVQNELARDIEVLERSKERQASTIRGQHNQLEELNTRLRKVTKELALAQMDKEVLEKLSGARKVRKKTSPEYKKLNRKIGNLDYAHLSSAKNAIRRARNDTKISAAEVERLTEWATKRYKAWENAGKGKKK
jgi:hypothetical protein